MRLSRRSRRGFRSTGDSRCRQRLRTGCTSGFLVVAADSAYESSRELFKVECIGRSLYLVTSLTIPSVLEFIQVVQREPTVSVTQALAFQLCEFLSHLTQMRQVHGVVLVRVETRGLLPNMPKVVEKKGRETPLGLLGWAILSLQLSFSGVKRQLSFGVLFEPAMPHIARPKDAQRCINAWSLRGMWARSATVVLTGRLVRVP